MRIHHCHISSCKMAIKPALLFCSQHWAMVPEEMQKRVYDSYRAGQCDDKNPSKGWVITAMEARRYVEKKLKKKES